MDTPLTQEQVIEQISVKKTPFVFMLATGNSNDKHLWVARGYKVDGSIKATVAGQFYIYVNDPAPVGTGAIGFMPYNVYSTLHEFTYYNLAYDQGQTGCAPP